MIKIGEMNKMVVDTITDNGFYLRDESDETINNVFLSTYNEDREQCSNLRVGNFVDVFVYLDKIEKYQASLKKPKALIGEIGFMKVKQTHAFGAFFEWGVNKDLFVPDSEQRERVGVDQYYAVRVCIDPATNKLYGTTKLGKFIGDSYYDIKAKQKVSIVLIQEDELGFRCIINRKYVGIVYYNEIFKDVNVGDELSAYVKKIRDDGLVDIALQAQGFDNILSNQEKVLNLLKESGGRSHLNDKSSPDEIRSLLNISKKTFKATIGTLYKEKKILITKNGIELI